jgi:hypothetical protein
MNEMWCCLLVQKALPHSSRLLFLGVNIDGNSSFGIFQEFGQSCLLSTREVSWLLSLSPLDSEGMRWWYMTWALSAHRSAESIREGVLSCPCSLLGSWEEDLFTGTWRDAEPRLGIYLVQRKTSFAFLCRQDQDFGFGLGTSTLEFQRERQ